MTSASTKLKSPVEKGRVEEFRKPRVHVPPVKGATRSDRLLALLSPYEQVLVLTHDNPDPDGVASSWGLSVLIREKLKKSARVVAGGAVVRAENLRMMELLSPPLEFVEQVTPAPNAALLLVDCTPAASNHLLGNAAIKPLAVIDHHQPEGARFRVPFRDIRPKLAATATIVSQYLRDQQIEPEQNLATALLYAIRTDAVGHPAFSRVDQRMVSWLSHWASHKKLADIENAPLSRAYYGDLLLAMENTFVYEDAALCYLPRANGAETVGEVADLLIRCHGVNRVLCGAVIGKDILFSARTRDNGGDASELVQKTLAGLGHGGGHRHRAGGKAPASAKTGKISEDLQVEIRNRWLKVCGLDAQRGLRLVPRKDILENL